MILVHAPTFHINVSGSVVAAYAAIVSTVTGVVQFFNYRRDRARIKVSVRHNQEMIFDPRYSGKTLTIITVTNEGRRPVTVNTIGATRPHPQTHLVLLDNRPSLPHELTEGKNLIAILPESEIDLSTIESWYATNAVGQTYWLHVASWYARAMSRRRMRREWRRNKSGKKDSAVTPAPRE
jgi:hypothetical protein